MRIINIANKLTVLRIILVPIFILSLIFFATDNYIAVVIFTIASLTDLLDGYLARKYKLVTTFGKFIDPIADKILTLSAFIMLIEVSNLPAWGVCIIVAREIAITGFRTIAASSGLTIAASKLGKVKTTSQMISIILLLLNIRFGIVVFYIAVFFTLLSGVEYIYNNKNILDLNNI